MSEENLQIARRMWEAFRDRDWEAAFELVDDKMVMDTSRTPIEGLNRIYRGREDVARFWIQWLEAWGEQQIAEPELLDADDQVVAWFKSHRIKGRGSGVLVDIPPYAWVATVSDGKFVQGTMYMSREEALEAAGLSE